MKVIAIANQKGGVGKTTTALNLAACLAEKSQRVLLVDLDPQANATSGLGIAQQEGSSIYSCLVGGDAVRGKIYSTRIPGLCIIPSHQELAGCEVELAQSGNHLSRLRDVIAPLRDARIFDYVIFDCPPSLGIIMTSALAAADELIIPLQCEYFGLEGLTKIVNVVDEIRHNANPGLKLEGILMTMFDGRLALAQQVCSDVRGYFPSLVYQTIIPRTTRLAEAPSFGKSIIEYETSGRAAEAHRALAAEFLQRHGVAVQPVDTNAVISS